MCNAEVSENIVTGKLCRPLYTNLSHDSTWFNLYKLKHTGPDSDQPINTEMIF